MRKMTKTVAVVAAMSALTVASASVAFAAVDERTNLTALGKDVVADAAAEGEWDGDDVYGWTFTVEGEKLTSTWAQIDGAWYYFNASSKMAQDELVFLDGETYYFHPDGRMQANGWIDFDNESDVVYDYGLRIGEYEDDVINPVNNDPYATIWMYFDENGVAKDDEWFSDPASNLHYYFDDIIMVAGDYDHLVGNTTYGFGKDGHMYVGWEQNYDDLSKSAPNKDEDCWYYYNTNGKKFVADEADGFGWKLIEDKWYCFREEGASVGTLIVNAYFTNEEAAAGDENWYYVDKKGAMQTGVTTLDKDAIWVTSDATWTMTKQPTVGKAWDVLLGSKGPAEGDKWSGNRFYAKTTDDSVPKLASVVYNFKNMTDGITTYKSDGQKLYGQLIKNALVFKDDWYYVDKNGDKVTNTVLEVGSVTVTGNSITYNAGEKARTVAQIKNEMGNTYDGTADYKAYILVQKNGVIYDKDEEEAGYKIKVGGKWYYAVDSNVAVFDGSATGSTVKKVDGSDLDGMQIFYYKNDN